MGKTFKGRTEDAEAPFLGAEFWQPGVAVNGVVKRLFDSQNGRSYVLDLVKPVAVAGEEESRVSVGNMKGFQMALQAAGLSELVVGDQVHLECVGVKPPTKVGYSPRVNFAVEVTRA